MELSERAKDFLTQVFENADAIQDAWDQGNFGGLYDSETNEYIRPATAGEAPESYESSPEGHFDLDGRTVFVRP